MPRYVTPNMIVTPKIHARFSNIPILKGDIFFLDWEKKDQTCCTWKHSFFENISTKVQGAPTIKKRFQLPNSNNLGGLADAIQSKFLRICLSEL